MLKTEINKRVEWTYRHWLNSKSFTYVTKQGTFLRNSKKAGYAVVLFDGNKTKSQVLASELKYI